MTFLPKRVGAAGFASVVLAACGAQAGSQSTGLATATLNPSHAAAAALRCNLPVTAANGGNQLAGFLAIPSGKFTPDPNANGVTYDWAYHRWLPVSPAQVSPDGSAYAYTLGAPSTPLRNEIHLVNLASGSDRVIYNQGAYEVLAYQPEGIYLDYHLSGTDASSGLWVLDPVSGSLKAFPAGRQATWAWIAAGGAWSYSLTGNRFGSNQFARLDLATGTITTLFTVDSPAPPGPGSKSIRVFAFDGSYPMVQVYMDETTSEIWRLTAPGQGTRLPDLPFGVLSPPSTVSDSHGIWLITPDRGVYLYSGGAFARVASAAPPAFGGWFMVAGSCGE